LDLLIIIENSLVEWKELEDEGYSGDEWEDRKRRIRKVSLSLGGPHNGLLAQW
jgi:hypothetical protein